jgi:hypothetical protein
MEGEKKFEDRVPTFLKAHSIQKGNASTVLELRERSLIASLPGGKEY